MKPFDYIIEVPDGRGGPGRGQGRKEVADKKKQVYLMIRQSAIEKLGGESAVKLIMESAISNELAKLEFEDEPDIGYQFVSNTGEKEKVA